MAGVRAGTHNSVLKMNYQPHLLSMSKRSYPLRRHFCVALVVIAIWVGVPPLLPAQQSGETPATQTGSVPDQHVITIPDGTPVELRFAQAVRGKMLDPVDVGTEAQPGNTVRLVAVAELRVGELIVIQEGAKAQATVTAIKRPLTTLVATGLGLQLDWVEDITGQHLPLRVTPKGEPQPFMAQVLSTAGGVVARPETLRGDIVGKNSVDVSQIWRDKHYITAGTRIMAYVHSSPVLDRVKVEEAQARVSFAGSETGADVTIYRTKGHGGDRPRVLCDRTLGHRIGEREYIHLNLTPGKHSCQVENQTAQELAVEVGQQYFFHLQPSGSGWELKKVTVGEGEDSTENSDPAPKY